jgi:hypothetical protein
MRCTKVSSSQMAMIATPFIALLEGFFTDMTLQSSFKL